MTFAEKLKKEQKRLGLTQVELAALLEVAPRSLWDWLQGGAEPLEIAKEGALARLKARKSPRQNVKAQTSPTESDL